MDESSKRGSCVGFGSQASEIVSEILARLPVECILRYKCVCKTWYALIKDDYFVKLQLSISNDRPSCRVIFFVQRELSDQQSCVGRLYFLDIQNNGKCRELPRLPLSPGDVNLAFDRLNIVSVLNGLICVAPKNNELDPVIIYNPLIRGDYIILPKSNNIKLSKLDMARQDITLGFDPSINKYKAVRVFKSRTYREDLCEVITLGDESSWRRMVSPFAILLQRSYRGGVFHQGSIYWIIDRIHNNYNIIGKNGIKKYTREYILEFDVTKEIFRTIRFPRSIKALMYRRHLDTFMYHTQLNVIEGESLALMEYDGCLLHVWRIAKQNGNRHVVRHSSISIELPHNYALLCSLVRLKDIDDYLFLHFHGCFGRGKTNNELRMKTSFYYYYPHSDDNDRLVNLSSLPNISTPLLYPWCFKPSLLSVEAASIR